MEQISADDWEQMAREQLETAEILVTHQRWKDGFGHGGYAVEYALKCRIMRVRQMDRWPETGELLTHNLVELAKLAELTKALLREGAALTAVGMAWMVARGWRNEVRYDPRSFPPHRATDMVGAIGKGGLLEWLLKP